MMAFLNGKKKSRIVTSFILILTLIVTYAMPMSVFADVPSGGGSYWQVHANGFPESFSTGAAVISKTITGTAVENEFDITLKVETKNRIEQTTTYTGANIVLVIDTSQSMAAVKNGTSRLQKAQTAAKTLINQVLTGPGITYNKIGLVSFDDTARKNQELTNSAIALNGKIDGLGMAYGTNIQDGLVKAQEMLAGSPAGVKKYIVLLSDGEPNRSYKGTSRAAISSGEIVKVGGTNPPPYKITQFDYGTKVFNDYNYSLSNNSYYVPYNITSGSNSWRVNNNGIPTISEAIIARGKTIEIYSIACGLDSSNNDAKFTLRNCAPDDAHYKSSSDNLTELINVFDSITQNILIETQAWKVDDPMGQFITLKNFVPENGATASGNRITWDLRSTQVVPEVEYQNGVPMKYTYTLTYKVVLDTDAEEFKPYNAADPTTVYQTNGTTTLTYTIKNGANLTLKTAPFSVPKVKGNLPKFDVTVRYHEVPANGTAPIYLGIDKNVTLSAVTKGSTYGAIAAPVKENWRGNGDEQLSPDDYYPGEIQASDTPVSSTNHVIDVYYKAKLKMPYTVNYYKDQVGGELLGTTPSAVSYVTGTAIDNISGLENLFTPENYRLKAVLNNNGNALSAENPLSISETAANNIINVVYEAIPKFEYRIEYYLGDDLQSDETVTDSAFEGAVVSGSAVIAKDFPNWQKQRTVFGSGEGDSITITSNPGHDQNVIRVYYVENDKYSYSIQHIAIDRLGNEHLIMTTPGTSGYVGTPISKTTIDGKVLSPAEVKTYEGYGGKQYSHNGDIEFNGTAMGDSFQIIAGTNEVKIYYEDADIYGYTVNYYKDNADTPFATVPVAAQDGYYDGTKVDASEIDTLSKTPGHYHLDKVLEGADPIGDTFTITSNGTVINVYYVEDSKYGYTVEYYVAGSFLTSVTPEETYYEGTIINTVDDGLNKPAGFTLGKVVWGNSDDADSLTISSTQANNVIKVYYIAAEGTLFTVEHYKQLDDGTYPADPDDKEDKAGTTGAIVLAETYVKSYTGYQYSPNAAGSVTSATINGEGTAVLKLYYEQDRAPLNVKHYYGDEDVVTKDTVYKRIGTPVTAAQERKYGYKLDHILVNGESYEGTSYQGTMESNEGDGVLVEFYYVKASSMIELTRHYKNLTTGATADVPDDIELTDMVANLVESAKNVWEGITYKFVSATVKSEIAADIVDQLKGAVNDLILVYDEIVKTLNPDDIAQADAQYEADITGAAVTLQNAKDALELKKQALATERDNDPDVAAAHDALTAAQGAYDSAVRSVVTEGLTFAGGELDTLTYAGILAKYDALISDAEQQVETQTGLYNDAVKAVIAAETADEEQALEAAQTALSSATEPTAPDSGDFTDSEGVFDQDGYDTEMAAYVEALAAYDALKDAVTQAESVLAAAEAGVVIDPALRATLDAAETALTDLEGYKADFVSAAGALLEKAALDTAQQNYNDAQTAALNRYLEVVAQSDEQKAVDEAQKVFDEIAATARAAYNQTIRTLVEAADPALAEKLQAAETALSEAMAAAGVKDFGPDDIMLLEAYEFSSQMDYVIDVYYEYKVDPVDPVDPGNPGNPSNPRDRDDTPSNNPPVIIRDEQVPAGPVEPTEDITILDDQVPAGPLPKTGGLDALLLYGLGALLAGGGFALRRKEKNK